MGTSAGGWMVWWLWENRPDLFHKGIVIMSGRSGWYGILPSSRSKRLFYDNNILTSAEVESRPPLMLVYGTDDQVLNDLDLSAASVLPPGTNLTSFDPGIAVVLNTIVVWRHEDMHCLPLTQPLRQFIGPLLGDRFSLCEKALSVEYNTHHFASMYGLISAFFFE